MSISAHKTLTSADKSTKDPLTSAAKSTKNSLTPAGKKNTHKSLTPTAKSACNSLTPARQLALKITCDARMRKAYVREFVDTQRRSSKLDAKEFNFAQVLCFGVVMCSGTLDEFINRNLNKPSDIKANVRDALRISAYELLFLQKSAHIVVSQGVELVRSVSKKASGLANCVLRRMAKDVHNFPEYNSCNEQEILARKYGMPLWLVQKIFSQYGLKTGEEILACNMEAAPRYIVENPYKQASTFASDISAQAVASLVPIGGSVLEIGAGRGTKTMLIQRQAFKSKLPTQIHAVDVHAFKSELLRKRMDNENIPNVFTYTADARDLSTLPQLPASFDCAFVDAPCSGTGTLRRHPEIRWRLQQSDIDSLTLLQLDLLKETSKRVKHGGTLIYATCSILREENEDIVKDFLASDIGKNFEIMQDFYVSLPQSQAGDGHFAAVFKQKS